MQILHHDYGAVHISSTVNMSCLFSKYTYVDISICICIIMHKLIGKLNYCIGFDILNIYHKNAGRNLHFHRRMHYPRCRPSS